MMEFVDWLETYNTDDYAWFIKRLSGNDTLATKSHQAGPYVPKPFMFEMFPELDDKVTKNPRKKLIAHVDSHPQVKEVNAIYYNTRFSEDKSGGRNETRLTGFGGKDSAVLDPESTGSIGIFAFTLNDDGAAEDCHIWICRHSTEAEIVEERFGPIDPGTAIYWTPKIPLDGSLFIAPVPANCFLSPSDLPPAWLTKFPKGVEIVERAAILKPFDKLDPDTRLMKRRVCEYELFQSLEAAVEFPHILKGFKSIDEFVSRAQTILQRRKARSGRSLELHARQIFKEQGLVEGKDFDYQPISESGKTPDFMFPSKAAYDDPAFPAANLRLLASKTTVKDRWRQVINEAKRIEWKHLLTLQEGVSETQFAEMIEEKVQLVVPKSLISTYPPAVRPHLMTFESFIAEIRLLGV